MISIVIDQIFGILRARGIGGEKLETIAAAVSAGPVAWEAMKPLLPMDPTLDEMLAAKAKTRKPIGTVELEGKKPDE